MLGALLWKIILCLYHHCHPVTTKNIFKKGKKKTTLFMSSRKQACFQRDNEFLVN